MIKIEYMLLLVVLIHCLIEESLQLNACLTPKGDSGTCIILISCSSLFQLTKQIPTPAASVTYLRESVCGYSASLPNVCCPNSELLNDNPLIPGLETCGPNTQDRIFGGRIAELGEFPWMAQLEYVQPKGKGFYCGGTLISSRYVLTAAHCVQSNSIPKSFKLISVRLGEHDTSTNPDCLEDGECAPEPVDVPIESIEVHDEYQPNDVSQPNDIALLRLARSVTFTDYIQPICLPNKHESVLHKSFVGSDLDVAGWGRTENGFYSNVKLKVKVPVVEFASCDATFQSLGANITEYQICAGGRKGEDSCQRDSGGPLMALDYTASDKANWFIIGIVSIGFHCGTEGVPSVYTKVAKYTSWISSKIVT